jgi:hypothetical protein
MARLEMVTAVVPVLCTVRPSGLLFPVVTVGKVREGGLNVRTCVEV